MKIELKNVKYAAFASHETNCFSATVYVDGKKAFFAENQGFGGPDNYTPINNDLYQAAKAFVASLPNEPTYNLPMNLEIFISDLLDGYLNKKRFDKISKTKTLFRLQSDNDGEWRTVNAVGKKAVAWILNKYPKAIIYK